MTIRFLAKRFNQQNLAADKKQGFMAFTPSQLDNNLVNLFSTAAAVGMAQGMA